MVKAHVEQAKNKRKVEKENLFISTAEKEIHKIEIKFKSSSDQKKEEMKLLKDD